VNLTRFFTGSIKAFSADPDWQNHFDMSETGFRQSFLALILSLPFYYICAAAILKQRAEILSQTLESGSVPGVISPASLLILLLAYSLMFPLCAYIFCLVFDKMDKFKPWVIARHWSFFFIAVIMAASLGLSLLGVLPFTMALGPVFALYMATLAIDIRFAQKIAGFEWGAAILAGCIITAMGLMIVRIGASNLG